jgi:O-antigen/teichoic acid export membrane protein
MAEAMRGTTGLYNAFLTAHARGRELRNAGMVLTISNVILNFALIPPFGAAGAAWASVLALVANLGAHIIGYRRVVGAPRGSVEDVGPTPERVRPAAP